MELNLRGQTALVTGSSRGIGLAIAESLAAEGCNVILTAKDPERLEQSARMLRGKYGISVGTHALDLSKTGDVIALGAACKHIDILVNNAGGIPKGSLEEIDGERWRAAWNLKVFGFIDLTREIYPAMCERRRGVIVNLIGAAADRPDPNYIAGCMGNAALNMLTQCLGGESMRNGVRVVAVNPGPVMTDRFVEGMEWRARKRFNDPTRWEEIVKSELPIQRASTVEEIAHTVTFLASDRASYVSGAAIRIDGGFLGTFKLND